MVSVGIVKYDIVLSKKSIIPHFTLVASVASVYHGDGEIDTFLVRGGTVLVIHV